MVTQQRPMGHSKPRRDSTTSRTSSRPARSRRWWGSKLNTSLFSHQVINNACASIAILNATLNIQDPDVELGEELENLRAFSDGAATGWSVQERVGADLFELCYG